MQENYVNFVPSIIRIYKCSITTVNSGYREHPRDRDSVFVKVTERNPNKRARLAILLVLNEEMFSCI